MRTLSYTALALGAALGLAATFAPAPASAQSKCPPLSNVEWWTNTVPEVRRVVSASYNGSWDAYIDRWKQQQRDLQQAYDTGNAVEIKSRALVFRGDDLKAYIAQVDERIKTLNCLKLEFAAADAATLPQGDQTATPRQDLPPPQEVKAVEGRELELEVAAICEGKTPAFQITNLGDRWPRLAEISIFRTDTNGMITQRRMRMTNSQQMIFKVPTELAQDAGEVGIFVKPSWYDRVFGYDATINCQ